MSKVNGQVIKFARDAVVSDVGPIERVVRESYKRGLRHGWARGSADIERLWESLWWVAATFLLVGVLLGAAASWVIVGVG